LWSEGSGRDVWLWPLNGPIEEEPASIVASPRQKKESLRRGDRSDLYGEAGNSRESRAHDDKRVMKKSIHRGLLNQLRCVSAMDLASHQAAFFMNRIKQVGAAKTTGL
jgi:hypothetical protein